MAQSVILKRNDVGIKIVSVSGINSSNFMVNSFGADNGIAPDKIISVMARFDSGLSTQPVSLLYSSADDILRIRVANTPTSGTLSIAVSYIM